MEPHVKAKFTDEVKQTVAKAVGVPADDLIANDGFESFVHKATTPDGDIFIKSMWSGRRTPKQIEAELTFVQQLADAGVSTARPVALGGQLVVSIPVEDGAFHVSATTSAPGVLVPKTEFRDEHFVQWGRLLGQMHRVASQQPACRALIDQRPSWQEEHDVLRPFAFDPRVLSRYDQILEQLTALPTDASVFGLIHTDVHAVNVHWVDTTPTVFDFDDCLGFWYVSDLAIVLYYTFVAKAGTDEIQGELTRNLASLRRGYETEFTLPDEAWDTLGLFLDLREVVLFLVCERSVPKDTRTEYFAALMDERFERIVSGQPAKGLKS